MPLPEGRGGPSGHGDDMVPLPRYTSVHGIPVSQLLSEADIAECV